ncbi:MAG: ABC transporter ATP-binding protein [Lautropia sp.]
MIETDTRFSLPHRAESARAADSAPAVLECRGVEVRFATRRRGRVVKAVDGVSIGIAAGTTVGLIGESGCGKSTLGRVLVSLLEPSAGQVLYRGEPIARRTRRAQRQHARRVQCVFQDPNSSFDPKMTLAQSLREPLFIHGLYHGEERQRRVRHALDRVGLGREFEARFPHEMSGGQKQRASIGRALMLDPEVLVCDEPVSSLDVSVQAEILKLFAELQRERSLAMLFITHDIAVVSHLAHRVAVMYLGTIVEVGETRDVLTRPRHPYTEALLSAQPDPLLARSGRRRIILSGDLPSPAAPPPGCRFHTRCPHADRTRCPVETPALRNVGGREVACHFAETLELKGVT